MQNTIHTQPWSILHPKQDPSLSATCSEAAENWPNRFWRTRKVATTTHKLNEPLGDLLHARQNPIGSEKGAGWMRLDLKWNAY